MRDLARTSAAIALFCAALMGHSACAGEPVTIAQGYDIRSDILDQTRRINVYLPPSYEGGEQAYPVLLMLDGGVQEDFIHIAGIASLAVDWRGMREFILVGIENIDRYHDLIHAPTTPAGQAFMASSPRLKTAGGAAAFRQFIADELLPYISRQYRVTDERVLMGESAAGMFTLETLLRQPELFTGYIAISPMLWWDDQSLAKAAPMLLQHHPAPAGSTLFLTIANEGTEGEIGAAMRAGVDRVADALAAHAPDTLIWTFEPMEAESHATILHPAALTAIRRFFATEKPE